MNIIIGSNDDGVIIGLIIPNLCENNEQEELNKIAIMKNVILFSKRSPLPQLIKTGFVQPLYE